MTSETVGTLFSHISRRNADMKNNNVITNSAEFGLIPQRDFFDKDIAVEGNTDKYYIIGQGDFVYNPRKSTTAPYGPFNCYQGEEEGIVSPLYTCLKPLYPEMADYLLWYFRSPAWYSYIYHNGAQGGARHDRVGMTNDLMDGIPVNLPCKTEQKKISEFLTLLDKRIAAQQHFVENLKSYKRGALSKLFPQEGASVPEVRLAGFTGDWEQCKLGDVGKARSGVGFPNSEQGGDEGVPFFKVSDMNITGNENEMMTANNYVSEAQIAAHNWNPITEIPAIFFAKVGAAVMLNRKRLCRFPFLLDNNTMAYSLDMNYWNADFAKALFETVDLTALIQVGALPSYNTGDIESMKIHLPSIKEQQQIGTYFKGLDDLITLHQQNVVVYEKIKRGLLQELFI